MDGLLNGPIQDEADKREDLHIVRYALMYRHLDPAVMEALRMELVGWLTQAATGHRVGYRCPNPQCGFCSSL